MSPLRILVVRLKSSINLQRLKKKASPKNCVVVDVGAEPSFEVFLYPVEHLGYVCDWFEIYTRESVWPNPYIQFDVIK